MAYIQRRATQGGKVHYRVQVRMKGHPTQSATFERKSDAVEWGKRTEVAIKERRHFKTIEATKHSLGDLVDKYLTNIAPALKSKKDRKIQLSWWKQRWTPLVGQGLICCTWN